MIRGLKNRESIMIQALDMNSNIMEKRLSNKNKNSLERNQSSSSSSY